MFADSVQGRKLVAELTFEVVGEVAPEEREIFNELLHEYYHPAGSDKTGDDPLGFGLEGTVHLLTPAAAALVTTLLNGLLSEAVKSLQEEGSAAIRKRIKALLDPDKEKKPAEKDAAAEKGAAAGKSAGADRPDKTKPTAGAGGFSREQLALVLKNARREAQRQGASEEEAERIANALFVRLALA